MSILRNGVSLAIALPLVGGLATVTSLAPQTANADPVAPCYYESRSGDTINPPDSNSPECGIYKGEVSISKAYVDTVVNRKPWGRKLLKQAVLLDVRSIPEYKAGHPENSYNVPYPFIYQECEKRQPDGACIKGGTRIPQPAEDFVSYVEKIVPNKNTPIYTLCRTGVRSVGAANRLTEAGYKNVYNIWEGFVGVLLKAPFYVRDESGNVVYEDDKPLTESLEVDLNHDGELTDADKNGWKYHGDLPYTKRLRPHLIYRPYVSYYWYD